LQDIGIHFASFSSENLFFDFFILNRDEEKCKSGTSENKKLNQTLILSKTLPIIIKTDSSRDFGFRDEGESSVEECYAFSGFAV
jgi:hypothetical protein